MFAIEIPRDPNHAPTRVSLARLWLTDAERTILNKVSADLETSLQTSLALLHEGHRKWEAVCEALEIGLVASPARPRARQELELVDQTRSYFYDKVAAHVPTVDPVVVTYTTQLPPEAFGDSRIRIEAQLRDEVRHSCAVAFAVLTLEHLERPVGVVTMERGFVEIPFPFVRRFYEPRAEAPDGDPLDVSVLDSPEVFRHGLEF